MQKLQTNNALNTLMTSGYSDAEYDAMLEYMERVEGLQKPKKRAVRLIENRDFYELNAEELRAHDAMMLGLEDEFDIDYHYGAATVHTDEIGVIESYR